MDILFNLLNAVVGFIFGTFAQIVETVTSWVL